MLNRCGSIAGGAMEKKVIKINKNKSGSGSISNRIILPASWVKDIGLEGEIKAFYDKENKRIILEKGGR